MWTTKLRQQEDVRSAWHPCMGCMHGKMHIYFLPRTAQLCYARHHTPQRKQIFPSAKCLSPTGSSDPVVDEPHLALGTCFPPHCPVLSLHQVCLPSGTCLCTYRQLSNKPSWTNRYIITYTSTHPFQKRKLPALSHMTNKW